MLDNQLVGVSTDSVTGYLEPSNANKVKIWEKTAFLKDFRQTGDITACANKLGYKGSEFLWLIKHDTQFALDFQETKLDMKHELEGLMYQRGLTNNGHKERLAWLEAQFPEEYGKKKPEPKKKTNPVLDNLMKDL